MPTPTHVAMDMCGRHLSFFELVGCFDVVVGVGGVDGRDGREVGAVDVGVGGLLVSWICGSVGVVAVVVLDGVPTPDDDEVGRLDCEIALVEFFVAVPKVKVEVDMLWPCCKYMVVRNKC